MLAKEKTIPRDSPLTIANMPLTARHWYIVFVASMEQLIGASLSTIVGIIIPLLNLILHPELSSTVQGFMGASGLIGIAMGSAIIGPLSDKHGYAAWFKICPTLILAGSIIACLFPNSVTICLGLLLAGFGLGGGYTLDSSYISELMPDKWRSFMVGVSKAASAIGFIIPAVIALIILRLFPTPDSWRYMICIIGVLALITFLLRVCWPGSPQKLALQGKFAAAQKAASYFFGKKQQLKITNYNTVNTSTQDITKNRNSVWQLFKGRNLCKVIYSGVPWACEGLGVYGIGVFLPVLIMSLGIDNSTATGIPKIVNSIGITAIINFSILPGFIIGLIVVRRMNHNTMLWSGFAGSAIAMGVLLSAYCLHWPSYISICAFAAFEILLNAGPHLVTFIIPTEIYQVEDRGAGTGVADFLGKLGAILGVFFMPMLLKYGGMKLVLSVTIAVMIAGGIISLIFGRPAMKN